MTRRPGRRGAALLAFGVMFVLSGLNVAPATPGEMLLLHLHIPAAVRAGIWVAAGLVAISQALRPAGRDRWGFIALMLPLAITSVSYVWSSLVYLTTTLGNSAGLSMDIYGSPGAWAGAIEGLFYLLLLAVISGWPDVAPTDLPEDTD